jgi:hypothetical protein
MFETPSKGVSLFTTLDTGQLTSFVFVKLLQIQPYCG